MVASREYLDPKVLNRISSLGLKARLIVEGFLAGLHRSPYRGFSLEFSQHREYVPGDDLRHLDWKVFGRTDRLYLKEYEQEMNLRCTVLLDASESMSFASEEISKIEYARRLAASMAYLVLRQQDAVGLAMFDREVRTYLPASSSPAQLSTFINAMTASNAEKKTALGAIFHDVAERIPRRGMVVVLSDLFDQPDSILDGLKHLHHRGHEVVVFHILDPEEASFPFRRMTLFDGLEEMPKLLVDPRSLRKAYLEELSIFRAALRAGCQAQRIDFVDLTTDTPLDVALSAYLAARLRRRK